MNIKKIATWFKFSGFLFLVRKIIQKNRVPIIYYHRIGADLFDKHLTVLKKYYNIVSLPSFLAGETNKIKSRLIITFDDGHISNFELLPVLRKHNVTITIFLTTGLVDSRKHFWFLTEDLGENEKEKLKNIKDEDRLKYLKVKYGHTDSTEYNSAQVLNGNQVLEMVEYVDFQSHTVTHPILPLCSEEKALREIKSSKEYLEKLLDKEINCLAFPNNDYTEREIEMSLNSGYQYLFTANHGFNNDDRTCLLFKRISTNDTNDLDELLLRVSGIWRPLKLIYKRIKRT